MRSMKTLLLVMCFFVGNAAWGQKIRFTDSSNRWMHEASCTCGPEIYYPVMRFGRDTLLHGFLYRTIDIWGRSYGMGGGYVREDTGLGLVYFYNPGDSLEHVLYDYNWVVGSVIRSDRGNFHSKHVIDSMWVTLINGVPHKTWHADADSVNVGVPRDFTIVEGIGCVNYMFFPIYPLEVEGGQVLICFENRGLHPTLAPAPGYFDNTNSCALSVESKQSSNGARPIVLPNPGGREMMLNMPAGFAGGSLGIYDVVGGKVREIGVDSNKPIRLGQYLQAEGVYYYSLQDRYTGRRYTGRFIYR